MAMRVLLLWTAIAVGFTGRVLIAAEPPVEFASIRDALRSPILDPGTSLNEVRAFVTARIPRFEPPESALAWQAQVAAVRTQMLDQIIFRGEAAKWRDSESRVQWFDAIDGGSDYVIRKFRYEALPGLWIPALLYEPKQLAENAPVFINLNGHDRLGKATPETQRRCINLAKRGGLAFLFEFLYFGQLRDEGNRHNALVQIDLCGTGGVAPFFLALTRGLDAALAHPHADPTRVAVAGLSGGGWQTIMLAALDERITLANPVAGHASLFTRAEHSRDVGDCEQVPADMATVADYTHLTAMLAPRPLLLTFNAKDECCFLPDGSLPMLESAARPVYALFGAADRFRTHVNHDPGTHNFERENREMFYRLVGDFFYANDPQFDARDCSIPENELKGAEELAVPMPAVNATLNSLAIELSRSLPKTAQAASDQTATRRRLRDIIHLQEYACRPKRISRSDVEGTKIVRWQMHCGDDWTVPAVELTPANTRGCTIVLGDQGRRKAEEAVRRHIDSGERVLAVDLLGFGEAGQGVEPIELQMIATVGERLLGVQVAQLIALAERTREYDHRSPLRLVAVGPRSSVIALVAAALAPELFTDVERHGSWPTLKEFINKNLELKQAPELGCFGLLEAFDIPQFEALAAP